VGKLLVVEDDPAMIVALSDGLQYEGHNVTVAATGAAGLDLALADAPDLIILDVMLPKMSGFEVCKSLRDSGSNVPIIMLTAKGQEIDKVTGLKCGADDYVTKPFSFLELTARIEAVLRRRARSDVFQEHAAFGDVEVQFQEMRATKAGESVELTPREFKLLRYLVMNRGVVLTRERLLEVVWGYHFTPVTRTVDMHIAKLRRKLEDDPEAPAFIETVHGAGYRFTAQPRSAD